MAGRNRGFGRWIHILVDICLIAVIVLVLCAAKPTAALGTDEDARAFQDKLEALQQRIESGERFEQSVDEKELNAYLAAKVERTRQAADAGGLNVDIDSLSVTLDEQGFVFLVVTRWRWQRVGKRISCEVRGVPRVTAGVFRIDITGSRVGRLPLPGPGAEWMASKIGTVFAQSGREREILGSLSAIELHKGQAVLRVN